MSLSSLPGNSLQDTTTVIRRGGSERYSERRRGRMSSDDLRTSRAEVTQESVLGNPDVFELVEARGKLAACYVDAGTGQTIMYLSVLRARPEDGRAVLHHQELLKIGSILKCFEDPEKKAEAHALLKGAFDQVPIELEKLGLTTDQLYTVKVGATEWYRKLLRDTAERREIAQGVREWLEEIFHESFNANDDDPTAEVRLDDDTHGSVTPPPGSGTVTPGEGSASAAEMQAFSLKALEGVTDVLAAQTVPFQFSVLSGAAEATFEWTAIRAACGAVFPGEPLPDAALAGGGGSVQASSDEFFESFSCNLEQGQGSVLAEGPREYKNQIRYQFHDKFAKVKTSLEEIYKRRPNTPLRLVIVSSFFYAACACKAINPKDPPAYTPVADLFEKIKRLLTVDAGLIERAQNDPAELEKLKELWAFGKPEKMTAANLAKDHANVVRLTCFLTSVTSVDMDVQVLVVRNWKVYGKDYRTTWTTGTFLLDMSHFAKDVSQFTSIQDPKEQRRLTGNAMQFRNGRPLPDRSESTSEMHDDAEMEESLTTVDARVPFTAIPFTKLKEHGRLPRSDENLAVTVPKQKLKSKSKNDVPRSVFVSHRWLRPWPNRVECEAAGGMWCGSPHPDNEHNMKFASIIAGVEDLAALREWDLNSVFIWLDFACIDQDDPHLKMAGVNSLLGYASQCDLMLVPCPTKPRWLTAHRVPGGYGDRSWTRLESMCFYTLSLLRGDAHPALYSVYPAIKDEEPDTPVPAAAAAKPADEGKSGKETSKADKKKVEKEAEEFKQKNVPSLTAAAAEGGAEPTDVYQVTRLDYMLLPDKMPSSGELFSENDRDIIKMHEGTLIDALHSFALKREGGSGAAIVAAAGLGKYDHVVELLNAGVPANASDNRGYTGIHAVARYGSIEILDLLLERGADVETRTNAGTTALFMASYSGNVDVVESLLNRGAKVDRRKMTKKQSEDPNAPPGDTPLLVAASNGNTQVVEMLLQHKADTRLKNKTGQTPLMVAASNNHLNVVMALLRVDKVFRDEEHMDTKGETPFSAASKKGHAEVLQALQEAEEIEIDGKKSFGRVRMLAMSVITSVFVTSTSAKVVP